MFRTYVATALMVGVACTAHAENTRKSLFNVPVNANCISSGYGPRVLPHKPEAGTFHYGIDLPVPEGTPVRAAAAGVIMKVQRRNPGGLEMLIQHAGYISVYSHLGKISDNLLNSTNARVKAGEIIADVGHSGVTFGPHLYFGLIKGSEPVDPAPLLGLKPCNGAQSSPNITAFSTQAYFMPARKWQRLDFTLPNQTAR
jgi:murein DD-endopeptidase MepM/ murein hydrolase activator NlpD